MGRPNPDQNSGGGEPTIISCNWLLLCMTTGKMKAGAWGRMLLNWTPVPVGHCEGGQQAGNGSKQIGCGHGAAGDEPCVEEHTAWFDLADNSRSAKRLTRDFDLGGDRLREVSVEPEFCGWREELPRATRGRQRMTGLMAEQTTNL